MFIDQSDKWVHLLPTVGFGQGLCFFRESPGFEQLTLGEITEESRKWTECNHIRDTLLAVFSLLISVDELQRQGKLACPTAVLRTLPVLGAMFWCPEGSRMVTEAVRVLGCSQAAPVEVFEAYKNVIESRDEDVILKLQRLVDSDAVFSSWTEDFSMAAIEVSLPERVSPLSFTSLAPPILLTMLETEVKVYHN
jgi:hypothetical protein